MNKVELTNIVQSSEANVILAEDGLNSAKDKLVAVKNLAGSIQTSITVAKEEVAELSEEVAKATDNGEIKAGKGLITAAKRELKDLAKDLKNATNDVEAEESNVGELTTVVTELKLVAENAKLKLEAYVDEVEETVEETVEEETTEVEETTDVEEAVEETAEVEEESTSDDTNDKSDEDAAPDLPESLSAVDRGFKEYAKGMAKNIPITTTDALSKQLLLIRSIDNLLNVPAEDFKAGMHLALAIIREHRHNAFGEIRVFRHFQSLRITEAKREKVIAIVTLLQATVDADSKSDVGNAVDFGQLARHFSSDEEKNKLIGFYKS